MAIQTPMFNERAGRYARLSELATEDTQRADDMRRAEMIQDRADAIYRDDSDLLESLHDAWGEFSLPAPWAKAFDEELIKAIRAFDLGNFDDVMQAVCGLRDLATTATTASAEIVIGRRS